MRPRIILIQCVLLAFVLIPIAGSALAASQESPQTVQWDALASEVDGDEVSITLPDGAQLEGTVLAVNPDTLIIETARTSDPQSYPQGRTEVPRSSISLMQVREEVRGWAKPVLAAGVGTGVGLLALAYSIDDSRINVSDSRRITEFIALTTAGAVGGYVIGWAISTRERLIQLPNASALRQTDESLKVSLSPFLGKAGTGVSVSFRF